MKSYDSKQTNKKKGEINNNKSSTRPAFDMTSRNSRNGKYLTKTVENIKCNATNCSTINKTPS